MSAAIAAMRPGTPTAGASFRGRTVGRITIALDRRRPRHAPGLGGLRAGGKARNTFEQARGATHPAGARERLKRMLDQIGD